MGGRRLRQHPCRCAPRASRTSLMFYVGICLGSQRLLLAWSKNELPERADPLPINLLLAMVGAAIIAHKTRIALSLLLGFHILLRTNEIIYIHVSHFTFPQRCGTVLLVLPPTKSGRCVQNGPETATIKDPLVPAYVWVVVPRLQPSERLFFMPANVHVKKHFTD